jgi:ApaLI-like restriction endonuclease
MRLIPERSTIMVLRTQIYELAQRYREQLQQQLIRRVEEMERDDCSHFLIYRILGVSTTEGQQIDIYQNKGRFLYKYAGSFLEEATQLCLTHVSPSACKIQLPNTLGKRPKLFEIDCLDGNNAIEIKWRDATTDGDHITKEHLRLQVITNAGYKPIRIMYYQPNREQAKRIQATMATLYRGAGGEYYAGEAAWQYIESYTTVNLKQLLESIANEHDATK